MEIRFNCCTEGMTKSSVGLTFWLLLNHFPRHAEAASDFTDLLKPQLHSQINLRIPEYYYVKAPKLPTPLTLAISFLMSEYIPFRLFYNLADIRPWSVVSRPPKFTQNQAVWLIFVSLQSKSEKIDLYEVIESCTLGNSFGFPAVIHKDFIQLVVDESALAESWDKCFDFTIVRSYVPLYFVVITWSGRRFRSQDALLLRETWRQNDGSNFSIINSFIPKLKESNGVEAVLKEIRSHKRDFRGTKIITYPDVKIYGTWESEWNNFFLPFTFRAAHENWTAAHAGLFDSLISRHNFTLDFEGESGSFGLDTRKAAVHMACSVGCSHPLQDCYIPSVSLSKFEHYHTLFFNKPFSVESFSLPSLATPFSDAMAAITLLGSSLGVGITLLVVGRKLRQTILICLLVFSGLIGKSLTIHGNPKLLFLYSSWLLLAGVISMTYTNILQSHVIVPGIRYNDLSFEEMTKRNYSFESPLWKWMKQVTRDGYGSVSTREKILSERVCEVGKPLGSASGLDEFVEYYSGTTKRALVESNSLSELYELISKATVWDLVVGKESFLNIPLWWNFVHVERASLLADSVEILKQAGILRYFLQLSSSKYAEAVVAGSSKMSNSADDTPSSMNGAVFETRTVALTDSLVYESFVLFMYGVLAAVAVFVAEQLIRADGRSWLQTNCRISNLQEAKPNKPAEVSFVSGDVISITCQD